MPFNKRLLSKKLKKSCRFGSVAHTSIKYHSVYKDETMGIELQIMPIWDHRAIIHIKLIAHISNFVIPRINYKSRKINKEISKENKYLHNV